MTDNALQPQSPPSVRSRRTRPKARKSQRHPAGKSGADGKRRHKAGSAEEARDDKPGKVGRPSKYKPEFAGQAAKLCELGATDRDLAEFFEVTIATIWQWRTAHDEFLSALKVGKAGADERVERSLFSRANGYTFEAVKILQNEGAPVYVPYTEHVPPDVTACIFWLKNRRPDLWRDATVKEHTGKVGVEHSARELIAGRILGIASRLGNKGDAEKPDGPAVH